MKPQQLSFPFVDLDHPDQALLPFMMGEAKSPAIKKNAEKTIQGSETDEATNVDTYQCDQGGGHFCRACGRQLYWDFFVNMVEGESRCPQCQRKLYMGTAMVV